MAGTSAYPGGYDDLSNPVSTDHLNSPSHAAQHTAVNDAISSIEGELGTNPHLPDGSVVARLARIDVANPSTGAGLRTLGYTSVELAPGDHSHPLNGLRGLANVVITNLQNGDILQWNGTNWVNVPYTG